MSQKKLILVICALGYATSTMIMKNIEEFLEKEGIEWWEIEAVGVNQTSAYINDARLIVTSLELDPSEYNVPIINGVSLISGINKEATLQEILSAVKEM